MYHTTNKQLGQTLIETIGAIFILTTALTAGLALSIYVLSHSELTLNEITATNLAREGIDVVKYMRDTNWLESDAKNASPWNLADCDLNGKTVQCYPRVWEGVAGYHNYGAFAINGSYSLAYNNSNNTWSMDANPGAYALYLQSDGSFTTNSTGGIPTFARKIVVTHNTTAPLFSGDSPDNLSELVVTSIVGWAGRNCTSMGNPPDPSITNCNVVVTERFTNWKDYK
jgi:hypothetical protein